MAGCIGTADKVSGRKHTHTHKMMCAEKTKCWFYSLHVLRSYWDKKKEDNPVETMTDFLDSKLVGYSLSK